MANHCPVGYFKLHPLVVFAVDQPPLIQAVLKALKVKVIADKAGTSENYPGQYFKKHTGETMQQYIINYKLKLIENRLLNSNMRMAEIANELGFNDESQLNRIFKKYRSMNPSDFRKAGGRLHALV
ncbi:helix-turn-helix transcriptional regulator [Mucilaginibacter sp. cycad4]|uniref:helix-turn-helix domain-containing protein n=1 Tax=Mucilaginibacter sp. cycad4 TaxID=3342096 RepID=UPI002AAAD2A5|nr:helix-turn-helix transcriptional regulator [Mucilaginibacter gossypii]WPU99280.1 helix-turn-helix transcriptional regulator [Mucilaginibacter gossypii]